MTISPVKYIKGGSEVNFRKGSDYISKEVHMQNQGNFGQLGALMDLRMIQSYEIRFKMTKTNLQVVHILVNIFLSRITVP